MSNRNSKIVNEYKPTRKEINAMNHYWQVAEAQAKAVRNRKQRRNFLRGNKNG